SMKIRRTDKPFILRSHRLSDLAAAISGMRTQDIIMSNGNISRKSKEIIASTIERRSFARGSSLCMTESCRVYWNTSRNDKSCTS
ncbi:MAG: hypothetical protein ACTSPB_09270, partial [Candidatus Thorarchaeota archaeon]